MNEDIQLYFGKEEFKRLFSLFKQQVERLGKVGGSVTLSHPTPSERVVIGKWMGKLYEERATKLSVSLSRFEKGLLGTKFEEYKLWGILEITLGVTLVSKKEREDRVKLERASFFEHCYELYPHKYTRILLSCILQKKVGATSFISSYNQQQRIEIETIFKAVSLLPETLERLPVFAERIARDPHYFDKESKLIIALEVVSSTLEKRVYRSTLSAEEEMQLLGEFLLAKDDLHNFVSLYGLYGDRNHEPCAYWKEAVKEHAVQNIPLREIAKMTRVFPAVGRTVFVVENSGVFSSLLDLLGNVTVPIVCTHGNFKTSGLMLLERLIEVGAIIYYSGDIDANGVLFAERLRKKFGNQVIPWRMTNMDYLASLSSVTLSDVALKKLSRLVHKPLWSQLVTSMIDERRVGYQERLLNDMHSDIRQKCSVRQDIND